MSIIENGKKIAGNYKIQLAPEASTENAGVIKIATDQDIQDGTSEKLAVTPKQLNSYVSKDDISKVAKTGSYNDLIDVPEQYSLPIASTVELGGVKVDGDTINVDESGIISVGNLDNKANVSLSNLDAIGEAKIGSALNNNITNCLLEVPQRIKYDLTDGTLTIKAGSVVIVPYGTKDLTAQYPVGATFLNENFKVYDTQYTDGKFFVWAELVGDASASRTTTDTRTRAINIAINLNELGAALNTSSGTSVNNSLYYNTTTNYIDFVDTSGVFSNNVYCLPIGLIIADGINAYSSITQVFNGMGYIGSTVWLDKGITAICGQGYNIDGTIKNATHKNSGIELIDMSGWDAITTYNAGYLMYVVSSSRNSFWFQPYSRFYTSIDPITTNSICYSYVDKERQWYVWDSASNKPYWEKAQVYIFAEMTTKDNKAFSPKLPFRAVDVQDIDGKWVTKTTVFLNMVTLSNSETTVVSLSSYLPNDGNIYEVMFSMEGSCGTAQFRFDTGYGSVYALYAKSIFGGAFNMVVSPARTLNIYRTGLCSGTNKMYLRATAYRKVR